MSLQLITLISIGEFIINEFQASVFELVNFLLQAPVLPSCKLAHLLPLIAYLSSSSVKLDLSSLTLAATGVFIA